MPTITFTLSDFNKLVGKELDTEQIEELASYGKGDFEGYDKETDEVKIDFGDTNMPYLWSAEGFALLVKGLLELEIGKAKLNVKESSYEIHVDKSVEKVRPYVLGFVAKGKKIDDEFIKQIVQLQEKVCENFGRKRKNIAIGVYSYDKIAWPIHYKATDPESIKFTPLEFKKEMTQQEILEEHPKGIEYAHLLEGFKKYPILIDDKNEVLSFPPVINSNYTGRIEEGEEHLFIEATGSEEKSLQLAMNIFAYALQSRGFELHFVKTIYDKSETFSPKEFNQEIKISEKEVEDLLGIQLSKEQIKHALEKLRYKVEDDTVKIPDYRHDIMHVVDVIEDVAIGYGFMNIESLPLESYTTGSLFEQTKFNDKARDLVVGMGYQEVFSQILSNKQLLYEKMNIKDFGTVEIEEYMSESASVVRSWILPQLMNVLSRNKHIEYPQKIFEQGLITVRKKDQINDYERIAIVSAHHKADYTEIRQVLDSLCKSLGIEVTLEETEHDSFIQGRVARVLVGKKKVGYIGELSPKVLDNFGIEVPVAAAELNLSEMI